MTSQSARVGGSDLVALPTESCIRTHGHVILLVLLLALTRRWGRKAPVSPPSRKWNRNRTSTNAEESLNGHESMAATGAASTTEF